MLTLLDLTDDDLQGMSEGEGEVMLMVAFIPGWEDPIRPDDLAAKLKIGDEKLPFAIDVMIKRLQYANGNLSYSPAVVMWTCSLCATPGEIVMWAYALYTLAQANGGRVTLNDVAMGKFSEGVPTEQAYARIWASQKVGGMNQLDMAETWGHVAVI